MPNSDQLTGLVGVVTEPKVREKGFCRGFEGAMQVSRQIGFRAAFARRQQPPVRLLAADNSVGNAAPQGEVMSASGYASQFIEQNKLSSILNEAREELTTIFGETVSPQYSLLADPEDGSTMLFVEIPARDLRAASTLLSRFCHDWWYDRIKDFGHLLGFRVIKYRGM